MAQAAGLNTTPEIKEEERMPTLMSQITFADLASIREKLSYGELAPRLAERLAGICVPWAGPKLIEEGGIYLVGMATDGDYYADQPQTFEARLGVAEDLCASGRHDRAHTPFWQFLDGLTWGLLGTPFDEASDKWGWSNLLKIGWSSGNPNQWQPPVKPLLIDEQRSVCIRSLREEFAQLKKSLVVVATGQTFGVLEAEELFPRLIRGWRQNWSENWNKEHDAETGVWSREDPESGNLYVHCYHPGYAVRTWDAFWGSALGRIIHLAQGSIRAFGASGREKGPPITPSPRSARR